MIRPSSLTMLSALALSLALSAQSTPAPTSAAVRVGTWNLEQFGQRKPPRTDADFRDIATFIRDLGVSVLALQEIGGAKPMERLRSALGASWQFVLGSSGEFRDGSGRINVGFIWDSTKVELLQAEELLQLPREVDGIPIFHRVPVTAVFRTRGTTADAGIDFRLVTVHFKASRGAKNVYKRRLEVRNLREWLAKLIESPDEDRDILVLGDFNHGYDAPASQVFCADEFARYLRPTQIGMTIVHFDTPIDHIAAIGNGIDEELVPGSMRVHRDLAVSAKDQWRSTFSDHVPVTIDLDASRDRDPKATFLPVRAGQRLRAGGWAEARSTAEARTRTANSPAPTTAPATSDSSAATSTPSANRAGTASGGTPRTGVTPSEATPTGKTTNRPADHQPPPTPPAPIRPGMQVTVYTLQHRSISGRLEAPLADWVYVRTAENTLIAVPTRNISSIAARRD